MYLATASTAPIREAMTSGLLGQMMTPNCGHRPLAGVPWAADNGCFGDKWRIGKWFEFLDRYRDEPGCLFAVVPDVLGDAAGTARRWHKYADTVRSLGYVPAFVTQNGCVEVPADAPVVFTGGDDTWKLGNPAQRLIRQAKERGAWAHMGRVNSLRRIRIAALHGYDSVDGTYLAFGPDVNLPRLLKWLHPAEPSFFGGVA